VKLLAIPVVVVVLLAGTWLFSAVVFQSYYASIAAGAVWFTVSAVTMSRLSRRRPGLRPYVRGAVVATALVTVAAFWWTSVRETTVDEDIVTGIPAERAEAAEGPGAGASASRRAGRPDRPVQILGGRVRTRAHSAKGNAAVVRLPDGRRLLTLRDFDIDPGPQIEVRLYAGPEAASDYRGLGDLKGSRGNQQYRIARDVPLGRYDTVVFWCVAFNQALADAALERS